MSLVFGWCTTNQHADCIGSHPDLGQPCICRCHIKEAKEKEPNDGR